MGGRTRASVGMSTPVACMTIRMWPLPRRHRVAHLRALIRRDPPHSSRRADLVALLRDQLAARPEPESRTP